MTVYLCLSAPKFPTFNRWLRLVLTSALDEMTDFLDPPPLPVCFMLDELATLGHLPAVENAVGLAAGYGIQLVSVFQDTAQMRDLYKGRWASFIGNAGARALFNLDDFETADYWSKFIGSTLVETRSRQQDLYGYSQGTNVGEQMRPLIPTDRLMMDYAADYMLVLAQGAHPIATQRVPYWHDPELAGLWDDPRAPIARLPPLPRTPVTPPAPKPAPAPATAEATTGAAPAPAAASRSSAAASAAPAPAAEADMSAPPSPVPTPSPRRPLSPSERDALLKAAQMVEAVRAGKSPIAAEHEAYRVSAQGQPAPPETDPENIFGTYSGTVIWDLQPQTTPRNAPCPCGSGKKYKHCHGRM
jgi:hypothetical protein